MLSESPDTERELPLLPPQRIAGSVLFSVVLHIAAVLLFARSAFGPQAAARVPELRPSIRVSVVMSPPVEEAVVSEPGIIPVPEPEPVSPQQPPVAEAVAELPVEPAPANVDDDAGDATPDPAVALRTWTPANIRTAVQMYTDAQRSLLTEDWIAGCILERKEHGTRDCEQHLAERPSLSPSMAAGRAAAAGAYADASRNARHAGISQEFISKNFALSELMEAGGLLGELAADRYYLNREILVYLNGNRGDLVFGPMQNFSADVLGGPSLSLGGNVGFVCRAKRVTGTARGTIPAQGTAPCIYEYNGFNIERPEPIVDPNAFRVVPIVLGDHN